MAQEEEKKIAEIDPEDVLAGSLHEEGTREDNPILTQRTPNKAIVSDKLPIEILIEKANARGPSDFVKNPKEAAEFAEGLLRGEVRGVHASSTPMPLVKPSSVSSPETGVYRPAFNYKVVNQIIEQLKACEENGSQTRWDVPKREGKELPAIQLIIKGKRQSGLETIKNLAELVEQGEGLLKLKSRGDEKFIEVPENNTFFLVIQPEDEAPQVFEDLKNALDNSVKRKASATPPGKNWTDRAPHSSNERLGSGRTTP